MRQNLWKRLIAMWCIGSLLMTAPATNVLADNIQQETNASEIIDDSISESEISDDYSGASLTAEEMPGDEEDVFASESDESVEDAYHAADASEEAPKNVADSAEASNNATDDSANAPNNTGDDSAEAPNNAADDSVDTEQIEEAVRDDSSVEEDTSAILEAEDSSVEELVGANTWTVGNGVTAKIVKKDNENILYFTSKGGTLWKNWKSKIGNAVSTVNTITFTADSTKMYFPEDSSFLFFGDYLKSIKRIDLKKVDTSKVKSMRGMFDYCSGLTNLDVSGFDTSNVTSMEDMFHHCVGLKKLDVSGFNTSNVTNMDAMFGECDRLAELDVSGFDTSNVVIMNSMFNGCNSLESVDVSGFDTSKVEEMVWMFSGCEKLKTLYVSGFDTSGVNRFQGMFSGCDSLEYLDVSGFDTSSAMYMDSMFYYCEKLKKLDISGFDTSKVVSMKEMFAFCGGLTNLNLRSLDTSKVKDMESMFCDCKSLKELDISSFDTSEVTNMCHMFDGCENLKELDLSGFNTSKVENMEGMFYYCKSLKELDLSGFDTSHVSNMYKMFFLCRSLEKVNLSSFDTSRVERLDHMFSFCDELKNLDLSSFDISNARYSWSCVDNDGLQVLKTPKKCGKNAIEFPHLMYDSNLNAYRFLPALSKSIILRKKVKISECTITLSPTSYTFDGNKKEPTVTVKYEDTILKMGTDYTVNYKNNVDVGTATATITGKGFYSNTSSKNYTIKQALPGQAITIKNAKITGINRSYGYTGSTYTPNFKVVLNKKTLTANTDYTYTFEDNTNPGVAKLIINGKGTYHDKLIYEFVIVNCVAKPVVGKTYMLVPKNNPYGCLCTQGGKMVNNTKASITDQSSSESVKIVLKKSSDGNYKFMSAKCELVLAVQQNSTELGKGVVFYQNTTKTAQNWKLYRKADNSWAIVNAVTGYSIATPTATADKGSALIISKTAASSLQRFYFVETKPVRPKYDGTYSLRAARNKDYSVDIIDGLTDDGIDAVLYKYSGTNSQKFTAIYSGGGYYRLVNKKSGLVLSVFWNYKDNGVAVCQNTWAGLSGQRWKFTENGDGTVTLTNGLGKVLHLNTNTIKNGMYISSRTPADTTAQRWFLKKA